MKTIIIISFLLSGYLGNTQLIDPFGKIVTHEIKLTKLDNGAYMGAIEWTTGSIDSLQRYIIKGLDINAPIMVRIISKAPDHNIDLSFYKSGWDKEESKISTNGDKFVDKVFRTMNTAGLAVRSKVAGIPYLLIVKVGLQFPSTSLVRVTNDKEEYSSHLKKIGFKGDAFSEKDETSNKLGLRLTNKEKGNSPLLYIIIGLLSIIIILLGIFLFKRQKP